MTLRYVSLVVTATLAAQIPSHAAGLRVAPVPENQRSSEQQSLAARFASAGMRYLSSPVSRPRSPVLTKTED